eukprot:CAMPEP_0175095792 /NCGR_PEP_ID=MMETSP0086_2-20121207/4365_1 /TAXON_ID=136419 /ORGANISM="Unknown Unknown, Strain D1" /LENGTH=178 /DNA_ID=CAMNT_0016369105 /DNA_START=184 /DNA_END=717 /DNA_ORIENTATION=+
MPRDSVGYYKEDSPYRAVEFEPKRRYYRPQKWYYYVNNNLYAPLPTKAAGVTYERISDESALPNSLSKFCKNFKNTGFDRGITLPFSEESAPIVHALSEEDLPLDTFEQKCYIFAESIVDNVVQEQAEPLVQRERFQRKEDARRQLKRVPNKDWNKEYDDILLSSEPKKEEKLKTLLD